jgi:hypothetical protein
MAELRRQRYYTYDGARRSLIMWSSAPSDEAAIAYAKEHGAWNVVREDGPLTNPIAKILWKRASSSSSVTEE